MTCFEEGGLWPHPPNSYRSYSLLNSSWKNDQACCLFTAVQMLTNLLLYVYALEVLWESSVFDHLATTPEPLSLLFSLHSHSFSLFLSVCLSLSLSHACTLLIEKDPISATDRFLVLWTMTRKTHVSKCNLTTHTNTLFKYGTQHILNMHIPAFYNVDKCYDSMHISRQITILQLTMFVLTNLDMFKIGNSNPWKRWSLNSYKFPSINQVGCKTVLQNNISCFQNQWKEQMTYLWYWSGIKYKQKEKICNVGLLSAMGSAHKYKNKHHSCTF